MKTLILSFLLFNLSLSASPLLSTGHFLESKKQARQSQIFLTDESHSQSAMGEEERKSDEAAAAYRFQKMSYTKSPFIEPAKKAFAATVLILADGKKQSGFLASPDGAVITLYHPLKDAENITIEKDRIFYSATFLSGNTETDIAILQIPGHNFPYLEVASSRDILPGQWALLAGFPTRRLSVRRALISSLDREFLIVDTPFNKGELGGPLLNLDGDVIGINCSNKENLGLSIPLD
ncbi:MAG: trypsin-like peptidase domain-containing protein [Chlamydiales bacterium]|nr:trypsin-like peptidase domain-containing protein [Chlamydiales bacterium]